MNRIRESDEMPIEVLALETSSDSNGLRTSSGILEGRLIWD